jgi:ADP-heptose:LPS heptosyltransferase
MPSCEAPRIVEALASGGIRRVLAVRASRLGDLLFTTPAVAAFKARWPQTQITFLTNAYARDLLAGNPDLTDVMAFAGREEDLGGWRGRRLARNLRGRFDLLLALRPRRELTQFAACAGIRHLWPTVDADAADRSRHVVEQGVRRLAPLQVHGPAGGMQLKVTDAERAAARRLIADRPGPLVLAHPGCDETIRLRLRHGVARRVWPPGHWVELIDRLTTEVGARVVTTSGSRVEERWVERIRTSCTYPPRHVARPGLRTLAALAAEADVVVTVDTGPLHMATALGTPLVGLYGPSPIAFTGPWAPASPFVVLRRDLPCAPCQGKDVVCQRNVCMEEITPTAVLAAARRLLATSA